MSNAVSDRSVLEKLHFRNLGICVNEKSMPAERGQREI